MRIKKVSQTTPVTAQVVDGYSTSTADAYSAAYTNSNFINSSILTSIPYTQAIMSTSTAGFKITFTATTSARCTFQIYESTNAGNVRAYLLYVSFNSSYDLTVSKVEALVGAAPTISRSGNVITIPTETAYSMVQIYGSRFPWLSYTIERAS